MDRVLFVLSDSECGGNVGVGPVSVTKAVKKALRAEDYEYSMHLESLMAGNAPDVAYADLEDKRIYAAIHRGEGHSSPLGALYSRAYYEPFGFSLDLVKVDQDWVFGEGTHEYGPIDKWSIEDMIDFLVIPFGTEGEISIGFRVLPVTAEAFGISEMAIAHRWEAHTHSMRAREQLVAELVALVLAKPPNKNG